MRKNKIVEYIDWTDFLTHLHLKKGANVAKRESLEEAKLYTDGYMDLMADEYFHERQRLINHGYVIDTHCLTGGTICSPELSIQDRNEVISGIFNAYGMPYNFKSTTTEYGGDMILNTLDDNGRGCSYYFTLPENHPFHKTYANSDELQEDLKALVPKLLSPSFTKYKYFQNVTLEKEDISEIEFNDIVQLVEMGLDDRDLAFYPYFCPGYGVEIDILPIGLSKAAGVENIKRTFYQGEHGNNDSDIALEIYMGDFSCVELGAVDSSIGNQVLFVATKDEVGISIATENTPLATRIGKHKLLATIGIYRELADYADKHNGSLPDFDKGDFKATLIK